MKSFKYGIFDMDGTLLDSMMVWKNLGREYLMKRGINVSIEFNKIIASMSMKESIEYFQKEFGIDNTADEILYAINKMIEDKYKYEIPLKPYAKEYLDKLKNNGIAMCIATATPYQLAISALERLNILDYFSFVLSCDEIGVGKSQPDIYFMAAEKLGAEKKDIIIFEDADYALITAKGAGFYTIGVYDKFANRTKEEMSKLCDKYIESFRELM